MTARVSALVAPLRTNQKYLSTYYATPPQVGIGLKHILGYYIYNSKQ